MATRKSNSFFANATRVFASIANVNLFAPASEAFKYGYALVTRTFSITSMVLVLLLCSCSEDLGGLDNTGVMSTKPVEPELPTVKVTVDSIRQEAIVDFTYNGKVQSFTVKAQLTPEKEHIIEAENLPIASFTASATDTVGTSYSRIYTYPYGNGDDLVYRNVLKTSADKLSIELAAGVTVGVKFGSMSHNPVKESDNKKLSKPRSDEYEASYQTAYSGSASWSTFGAKENKSFGIPAIATNYRNIMNGKGQADIQEHIERKLDPENDLENVTVWLTDNGEAYGDTVRLKLHYGLTVEKPNLGEYTVTSADDYQMTTTATGNWGEWKSTSDSRVKRQEMPANGIMWDKDADNPQIATSWTLFREKANVNIEGHEISVPAMDYVVDTDVATVTKQSESDKAGYDMYKADDKLVAKYGNAKVGYDELSGNEIAKLYVKQSEAKIKDVQWSEVGYEHTTNALNLKASAKTVKDDGSKGKTETSTPSLPESWKCTSSWKVNASSSETAKTGTGEIKRVSEDVFVKDTTIVDGNFKWTAKKFRVNAVQDVTADVGAIVQNKWEGFYWKDVKVTYMEKYAYDGDALNISAPSLSSGTPNIGEGSKGLAETEYPYAVDGKLVFSDITRKDTAKGVIIVKNSTPSEKTLVNFDTEIDTNWGVLYSKVKLVCTKNWSDNTTTKTTANFEYNSMTAELTEVTSTEEKAEETVQEVSEYIVSSSEKSSDDKMWKFNEQIVDYKIPVYRPSLGNSNYKLRISRSRDIVYTDPEDSSIKVTIANPTTTSAKTMGNFAKISEEIKANNDTMQTWRRDVTFTLTTDKDTQSFGTKGTIYVNRGYVKPEKKQTGVEVANKTNSNNGLYHSVGAELYRVYDDGSKELVTTLSKGWDGSSRAVGVTTTENAVNESLGSVNRSLYSSNAKQDGKFSYDENTYLCTVSGSRGSGSYDYQWFITTAENVKYSDNVDGYAVNIEWSNFDQSATSSANSFTMTSETPVSGGKNQIWSRAHNLLYTINGQQVTIANTGVINTFVKDEEPPVEPEIKANITSILNTVCFTPARDGETGHTILLKLDNGNVIPVGTYGNRVIWGSEVADHNYNGAGFIANASKVMAGELVPCVIEYENGNEVILYKTWYEGQWAPIDRFELIKAQGAGWNNSGNVWEDKTGEFSYSTEQLNGAVKVTIGNESHTFKGISSARTRGSRRW